MKKSLVYVFLLVLTYIGAAHGATIMSYWPFSAPSVPDRDAIDPKVAGDIVFDTGDDGFFGWDGSSWIPFSSNGGGAQTFTPTVSGANQGNIAYSWGRYSAGTGADAGYMIASWYIEVTTGALGSGSTVKWTLPNSLTIDTADLPRGSDTTNAGRAHLGFCTFFQAGTGWKVISARYDSSTEVRFAESPGYITDNQIAYHSGSSQNSSFYCDGLRIPISGW